MKSLIAKRHTNLHKKHFRVGFECEFVLHTNKMSWDTLSKELEKIHPDIYTDGDGSIEYNWISSQSGVEIKTPPLTPYDSLIVLHKVFSLINKVGQTNRSCGLHASFSPVSNEAYKKVNPFKILDNPLWSKIKKDFKREQNYYCSRNPFNSDGKRLAKRKIKDPFDKWNACLDGEYSDNKLDNELQDCICDYDGHSCDVNFDNYGECRQWDSRIEIRCMGNENYQRKFGLVSKYVQQIISTLKRGYGIKFD